MHDHLVIPDAAINYILFQRTAYLRFPVTSLYRLFNRWLPFQTPLYNLVVAVESRLGRDRIKALYAADMLQEYASLRSALPSTCSSVLDIGSGVAGIDVLIQRHYAGQTIHFYLLDKSHIERNVFYLFQPRAAFYNSLDVSKMLLMMNGISGEHVHVIEANEQHDIGIGTNVDLVISLLSWGFHYPVATYAMRVREVLRDDGVVILDLRKGTDGMAVLRRMFGQIAVIQTTAKYERVVARK